MVKVNDGCVFPSFLSTDDKVLTISLEIFLEQTDTSPRRSRNGVLG
jgi:hypothetical protein